MELQEWTAESLAGARAALQAEAAAFEALRRESVDGLRIATAELVSLQRALEAERDTLAAERGALERERDEFAVVRCGRVGVCVCVCARGCWVGSARAWWRDLCRRRGLGALGLVPRRARLHAAGAFSPRNARAHTCACGGRWRMSWGDCGARWRRRARAEC